MEAPLREIVANCGEEPSVVLNAVMEGKGNYGYNAQTGEYGDMIEFGILDPTKVTRTALQNAASIAGLMITTEAMVAEPPKKDEPAMGGGGGGHGWYRRHWFLIQSPLHQSQHTKTPAARRGLLFAHASRGGTPADRVGINRKHAAIAGLPAHGRIR